MKETKGVLVEFGKPDPIEAEHYNRIAAATAEALADEIVERFAKLSQVSRFNRLIHQAACSTLGDWFLGDWKPGGKP